MPIQPGIFAKTFPRPTVEETFEVVANHGLNWVQFNMACAGLPSLPTEIEPALIERIKKAADKYNISFAAVSGTYNMIHPDQQVREEGLRRFGVLASACQAMGTTVITLCTGTRDPLDMWRYHPDNSSRLAWKDLLTSLEKALAIAEKEQLTLAFEPEHNNVISTAAKGAELLRELRSSRLKVVIDPANIITSKSEQTRLLNEAFDLLGEHIILAHAKDFGPDGTILAAGQGLLDYTQYIALLKSINFNGALVLHGLVEEEVEESTRFLKNKLLG